MITNIYAHILDEDRKVNAQKFETAFYTKRNPDLRNVTPPVSTSQSESPDLAGLIEKLQTSPELVTMLAKLINEA